MMYAAGLLLFTLFLEQVKFYCQWLYIIICIYFELVSSTVRILLCWTDRVPGYFIYSTYIVQILLMII